LDDGLHSAQFYELREHNLCVSSPKALEIVAEHAAQYARTVHPTTGRHFLWIDDGQPMCRCPKCRELSDSDQALLFENHVLRALRTVDAAATLCHLAYQTTIAPPSHVKPDPGIFLQFAPIERDTSRPLSDAAVSLLPGWRTHGQILELLDANLAVFGRESAQVLDYWLDNARASQWDRAKLRKLPWNKDAFLDDLATLGRRGIRHVRTYAVWFDRDYLHRFGLPPIDEYGRGLTTWRPDS
jgi:hypothetical protein